MTADFLIKTDSLGNIEFTNSYVEQIGSGDLNNCGFSVRNTGDGNFYYGLRYEICDGAFIFLLKLSNEGDTLWVDYLFGGFVVSAFDIEVSPDNSALICGYDNHYIYGPSGHLTKVQADGNILFNNGYFEGDNILCNLRPNSAGGAVVLGYDTGIWLFETDSTGNEVWSSNLSSSGINFPVDLTPYRANSHILLMNTALSYTDEYNIKLICYEVDTLSVQDPDLPILQSFSLNQPYPNPFNASTTIPFTLDQKLPVKVMVYNQLGQQISKFEILNPNIGENRFVWDAGGVSSGVYLIRLDTQAGFSESRKVMLVK